MKFTIYTTSGRSFQVRLDNSLDEQTVLREWQNRAREKEFYTFRVADYYGEVDGRLTIRLDKIYAIEFPVDQDWPRRPARILECEEGAEVVTTAAGPMRVNRAGDSVNDEVEVSREETAQGLDQAGLTPDWETRTANMTPEGDGHGDTAHVA